jgi:hypothetical protein
MDRDLDSDQPVVIILAGPNGAGKSTAAARLIPPSVTFLNADEIAKRLSTYPSVSADLEAGRILIREMDDLETRRADFAVETTLASRTLAPSMARLRRSGYFSGCSSCGPRASSSRLRGWRPELKPAGTQFRSKRFEGATRRASTPCFASTFPWPITGRSRTTLMSVVFV